MKVINNTGNNVYVEVRELGKFSGLPILASGSINPNEAKEFTVSGSQTVPLSVSLHSVDHEFSNGELTQDVTSANSVVRLTLTEE